MILLLVATLFFIIQLSLSGLSVTSIKGIHRKWNTPLSIPQEVVETMQEYMRQYRQVDAKVDAKLNFVAKADDDFVFLNKKAMYRIDLLTHFYLVYQLELSREKNTNVRDNTILTVLFLLELLLLPIFFWLHGEISNSLFQIYVSGLLALQGTIFLISMYLTRKLSLVLQESIDRFETLISLSDEELEIIEYIADALRLRMLNYPVKTIRAIVQFLLP